ncbi:hypothetical protein VU02_00945 [Desulfobulbus sp. N2]|nr:hypothetical protein [Desulfobulbus sp. US4]MCW5204490.1 hypothetical protein [Desulfobulbus sp. N2]
MKTLSKIWNNPVCSRIITAIIIATFSILFLVTAQIPLSKTNKSLKTQEKYMSKDILAFIIGVGATSIGFSFAVLWDVYKWKRDIGARDVAVMSSLLDDLESNFSIIAMNESILLAEQTILKQNETVVRPIQILRESFWDVTKLNIPKQLVENPNVFKKLKNIFLYTSYANEMIRSRESWRINSSAMSHFEIRLEIYNDELLQTLVPLKEKINEIKKCLPA